MTLLASLPSSTVSESLVPASTTPFKTGMSTEKVSSSVPFDSVQTTMPTTVASNKAKEIMTTTSGKTRLAHSHMLLFLLSFFVVFQTLPW